MRMNVVVLVLAAVLSGCATTGATTPNEKRQAILRMKQEVLSELYRIRRAARSAVARAPGHAVFSNATINRVLASA